MVQGLISCCLDARTGVENRLRRSYFLTVLRLLTLALAAACSCVRPFCRSLMMILTWASVVVIYLASFQARYCTSTDVPGGHF